MDMQVVIDNQSHWAALWRQSMVVSLGDTLMIAHPTAPMIVVIADRSPAGQAAAAKHATWGVRDQATSARLLGEPVFVGVVPQGVLDADSLFVEPLVLGELPKSFGVLVIGDTVDYRVFPVEGV